MTAIDTNVLVRALVGDGSRQSLAASGIFRSDYVVAIPLIVFCEAAWVLRSSYNKTRDEISTAFARILVTRNVVCDRDAVQFGIAAMSLGADFADAVIALEGERMGASEFTSFDRRAVRHLMSVGMKARLLA